MGIFQSTVPSKPPTENMSANNFDIDAWLQQTIGMSPPDPSEMDPETSAALAGLFGAEETVPPVKIVTDPQDVVKLLGSGAAKPEESDEEEIAVKKKRKIKAPSTNQGIPLGSLGKICPQKAKPGPGERNLELTMDTNTLFSTRAAELRQAVNGLSEEELSKFFGHSETPAELLMGVYMYNYMKLLDDIKDMMPETYDIPKHLLRDCFTMVAANYVMGTQARASGMKDCTVLGFDEVKRMAYWGSPSSANNCMWHSPKKVCFYSPSGDEKGIGGSNEDRSISFFKGLSGISCVILTVDASECIVHNDTHRKVNVVTPNSYVNYKNAKQEKHIICLKVIPLSTNLSEEEITIVANGANKIMCSIGGKPNTVIITHRYLKECPVKIAPTEIVLGDHQMYSHKGSYLMQSPSKLKQCEMVKKWFTTGAQIDLNDNVEIKNSHFAKSMKLLKEQSDYSEIGDWSVNTPDGPVRVYEGYTIYNIQFANWLLGRNGLYEIYETRGKICGATLYDPPITAPGADIAGLVSADWPADVALTMLGKMERDTSIPIRKLTLGNIQMFAAMKMYKLLPENVTMQSYLNIPREIRQECTKYEKMCADQKEGSYIITNAANITKHISGASELLQFVRVCGAGVLSNADATLFKFLQIITNPITVIGHKKSGPTKRGDIKRKPAVKKQKRKPFPETEEEPPKKKKPEEFLENIVFKAPEGYSTIPISDLLDSIDIN